MAMDGTISPQAIKLLGSYSLETVSSISSFISGVAGGVYPGFNSATISATQAAQAIYSNPQFLDHLSTAILNTITDPSELIAAAHKIHARLLVSAKNAFASYYLTMATVPANEKGIATGALFANVVIAMAEAEATPVAATAVMDVGTEITAVGAAEKVGGRLAREASASTALTGEMAEANTTAKSIVKGSEKIEVFGPAAKTKGPLHELVLKDGSTAADTFRSSSYFRNVLKEPLKLYRVYGGEAGELGPYWSRGPDSLMYRLLGAPTQLAEIIAKQNHSSDLGGG